MTKRVTNKLAIGIIALMLGGCSADLVGRQSPQVAPAEIESEVGIPYYLTEPSFVIQVKGLRGGKKANPVYDLVMVPVPDTSRRYEVALDSGTFSNDVFELELLPDGRLVSLGAESDDQTGTIIKSLASLAGSLATGIPPVAGVFAAGGFASSVKDGLSRCATAIGIDSSDEKEVWSAVEFVMDASLDVPGLGTEKLEAALSTLSSAGECLATFDSENKDVVKKAAEEEGAIVQAAELVSLAVASRKFLGWEMLDGEGKAEANLLIEQVVEHSYEHHGGAEVAPLQSGDFLSADDPKGQLEEVRKGIGQLEGWLRDLFEDNELTAREKPIALGSQTLVGILRNLEKDLEKQIANATPGTQLKTYLRKMKSQAETAFAQAVICADLPSEPSDPPTPEEKFCENRHDLKDALDKYDKAIGRLLQYDTDLRAAMLQIQEEMLTEYLKDEPTRTDDGNTSKAYRDYRMELDEVAKRIHERLAKYVGEEEKKKTEDLPDGDTVSRTLAEVKQCRVDSKADLFENNRRKLRLADLWIEYGGKDAVVFLIPSNPTNSTSAGGC